MKLATSSTIAALLLALGAVEGLAYWWMHPTPAGLGEAVLVYRPSRSADVSPTSQNPGNSDQGTGDRAKEEAIAPSSSSIQNPKSKIQNSTPIGVTPLPEIYDKAAPMLRCSGGQVLHASLDDSSGIHLAFFEWDGTDTGSVLEAFRHMPEACMGSIGLKLVEKAPARIYVVSEHGAGDRMERSDMDRSNSRRAPQDDRRGAGSNQGKEDRLSVVGGLLSDEESTDSKSPPHASISSSATDNGQRTTDNSSPHSPPSPDNRQPTTDNSPSSSPTDHRSLLTDHSSPSSPNPQSPISNHSLVFDHTVFREGGGVTAQGSLIHAFRAVWVSGVAAADARQGLDGREFDQLRTIRLQSALHRFRPAHARVIQGAVRGIPNPELAWQAFERTMLKDLSFVR